MRRRTLLRSALAAAAVAIAARVCPWEVNRAVTFDVDDYWIEQHADGFTIHPKSPIWFLDDGMVLTVRG